MKKEKNLIESKVLINTFKKFKSRNHIFKSQLKKKYYFFSKFQHKSNLKICTFFFKTWGSKKNCYIISNESIFIVDRIINPCINKNFFFLKSLMFINLYFY